MGKIHTITAVSAFVFIVVLLFILIHPVDFENKTIEQIYHANEGLIWFGSLGIGALIAMMTYINGTFQQDLKVCNKINEEKSEQLKQQNASILKNQLHYIDRIDTLTAAINQNRKDDTEVLRAIHKQNEDIQAVIRRVEDFENMVKSIIDLNAKIEHNFKRIGSIEKLIQEHDKDIRNIKKNK